MMNEWLKEAKEALATALSVTDDSQPADISLYRLAPEIFANKHQELNGTSLQDMRAANEEQIKQDCLTDSTAIEHYRFNFVSSYLYCFVLSKMIDRFKYDEVMEYVNDHMDLFADK